MENNKIIISMEQQFGEVIDIILQHKGRASRAVNNELLYTAWHVGGYVSAKLKSEEWGSKVVTQLSEYIRSQRPDIKGYSRRSIYNMVMFYDEYSSESFSATVEKYLNSEFVQPKTAQIEASLPKQGEAVIVQPRTAQIVPTASEQMPQILELTTLTNHMEIIRQQEQYVERIAQYVFECPDNVQGYVVC